MVDAAVEAFGGLHVAFNNAGIYKASKFADMTEDVMSQMVDVNFKSLVFCFKYQIPAMAKCGDKGSIIVNSSVVGSRVCSRALGGGVYAATKAGADMLMKYAAVEISPSDVRVNSVAPGPVDTPMQAGVPRETLLQGVEAVQLMTRITQPRRSLKW
ncbi:unnamed protein product [Laminaria digitata]